MKTITGVPESITRADYRALIEGAGFEPNRLRGLEFRMDGIYAEVIEEPMVFDEGSEYVDKDGIRMGDPAINRVFIPVMD